MPEQLTPEQMKTLAELSRLRLTSDETQRAQQELSDLFALFEDIQAFAGATDAQPPATPYTPRTEHTEISAAKVAVLSTRAGKIIEGGFYQAPPNKL